MNKKILFSIIFSIIFISACSNSDSLDKIKDEKKNIRGVVESIEDTVFTIQSRDRIKQGQVIVTKRIEGKQKEVDYEVGDTITVYYDKIHGERPAQINKVYLIEINEKLEDVDKSKEEILNEEIKYDELPLLSISNNDELIELSKANSGIIHEIIANSEWEDNVIEDFQADFVFMEGIEEYMQFNSKSGILNNKKDDIHVKLYPGFVEVINKIIEQERGE